MKSVPCRLLPDHRVHPDRRDRPDHRVHPDRRARPGRQICRRPRHHPGQGRLRVFLAPRLPFQNSGSGPVYTVRSAFFPFGWHRPEEFVVLPFSEPAAEQRLPGAKTDFRRPPRADAPAVFPLPTDQSDAARKKGFLRFCCSRPSPGGSHRKAGTVLLPARFYRQAPNLPESHSGSKEFFSFYGTFFFPSIQVQFDFPKV